MTHVLLTVVTFGLWIPFCLLSLAFSNLFAKFARYRCQQCGAVGNGRSPHRTGRVTTGEHGGATPALGCVVAVVIAIFVLVIAGMATI